MSSTSPLPSLQIEQRAQDCEDVFHRAAMRMRVGRIEAQAHVHLHAADGREVVALAIEEQAVEQRFAGSSVGGSPGTHDAVDVEQRLLAVLVLVDLQRVAHVRADALSRSVSRIGRSLDAWLRSASPASLRSARRRLRRRSRRFPR